MSISKSRRPKSERVARELENELLPDPKDYYAGTKYIDRRAELGDFKGKGKPASALVVLHYLWRHTVRSEDGRGLGPIEAYGWVLTGKSKIAKIATECNLSYNAAGATIKWLRDNGWLGGQHENGIELMLRVRMDMEGHKARLEILGQTVPTAGTVDGDRANEWQGTVPAIGGDRANGCGGTVPTAGSHYRDSNKDLERDFDSDRAAGEDQDQDQDQDQGRDRAKGESPTDKARLEELLPELARLRFNGDVSAAREDLSCWLNSRDMADRAAYTIRREHEKWGITPAAPLPL